MNRPVVALVGRPNVGKSSLFNRLLGRRKALVQDTPGVTRDRNYAIADLDGREIIVCDTGGFEEHGVVASGEMARLIRQQALVAIEEADVVVFVLDGRDGLTATDEDIAMRLRTASQPVIYVVNKCDPGSPDSLLFDFYRLGTDELLPVSAEHGLGTHDLIDAIERALPSPGTELGRIDPSWVEGERRRSRSAERRGADGRKSSQKPGRLQFLGNDMPEEMMTARGPEPETWDRGEKPETGTADDEVDESRAAGEGNVPAEEALADTEPEADLPDDDSPLDDDEQPSDLPKDFEAPDNSNFVPRIAILGRPNVGKSTLLNQLLGFQRSITSPEAGTTHDTVDAVLEHDNEHYVLIDTAGIRRRSRVHDRVEKLTVGRAIRTVEAAHMCLLLLDATEGVTEQEAKLAALIADRGRGLVIVVNKWDLVPGGRKAQDVFRENIQRRFPHLAFAETLHISALSGRGVKAIWAAVKRVNEAHRVCIKTGPLNRWARGIWEETPPPMHHHRPVRLYYCSQTAIRPPSFVFFCNQPKAVHATYRRFVINRFRATFPCRGTPIRIAYKSRDGS